jgi:hypothetical protein
LKFADKIAQRRISGTPLYTLRDHAQLMVSLPDAATVSPGRVSCQAVADLNPGGGFLFSGRPIASRPEVARRHILTSAMDIHGCNLCP